MNERIMNERSRRIVWCIQSVVYIGIGTFLLFSPGMLRLLSGALLLAGGALLLLVALMASRQANRRNR